ncbi:MAG TPA: helix-turn-helix transcriptional regulator [Solirubrobacteraceae bacterium]|nr:helix-turn-helix transcriptional regulator [Solirubrobacteraceae bacterium]
MRGGVDLVRFTQSLSSATSFEQLERAFLAGFGPLLGTPLYGYDLYDPATGAIVWSTRATAAEAPAEPLVELPLLTAARVVGRLHFTGREHIALAEALGAVIASTAERLDAQRVLERERDRALAALALTGAPVVTTDPGAAGPRLNDAARRLLAEVVDGDARLRELLARPASGAGFSRRLEVELANGEHATIHGHSTPMPFEDGEVLAVLELEREHPGLAPGPLAALTPREQEVAVLVVDGLADREIAERLCLSHHTVTQYVKRIYRKIEVDSRVGLTRLLLTARR